MITQMEGKRVADLDQQIAKLEQRLLVGDIVPKSHTTPYTTPMIEQRLERLKELQASLKARQAAEMPELAEARARHAYEASIRARIASLKQTLALGDFSPPVKRETRVLSDAELKLKREAEDLRHEVLQKYAEYHLAHLSGLERAWDVARETAHLSRALILPA